MIVSNWTASGPHTLRRRPRRSTQMKQVEQAAKEVSTGLRETRTHSSTHTLTQVHWLSWKQAGLKLAESRSSRKMPLRVNTHTHRHGCTHTRVHSARTTPSNRVEEIFLTAPGGSRIVWPSVSDWWKMNKKSKCDGKKRCGRTNVGGALELGAHEAHPRHLALDNESPSNNSWKVPDGPRKKRKINRENILLTKRFGPQKKKEKEM